MKRVPENLNKLLIIDACVLIDYLRSDQTLPLLISRYVGKIHIVSTVLEEIEQIKTVEELEQHGIVLVEPELEDLFVANSLGGKTSFQDNVCLLTAKRNGFTCITNDKCLRNQCKKMSVPLLWGLQLIIDLCRKGGISSASAIQIGETIRNNNSKHITRKLIEKFKEKINNIEFNP